MSMITATAWVPRGYAAEFPTRHEFDQDEYDRISKLANLNLDDAKASLEDAKEDGAATSLRQPGIVSEAHVQASGRATAAADDDDLKEYNLEQYDDEPDEGNEDMGPEGRAANPTIFGNIKALAYHQSNDEDPYITLRGGEPADSDDEDREDLQILPSDSLLLAARIEDEIAHLEVHVYEDDADNLYVHHDIMLPAVPLCVEWLDFPIGKAEVDSSSRASFVAVGTMDPDIELWDLDTMDSMFPNAILGAGGLSDEGRAKKKKKKSRGSRDDYHVDAVLSLAANRQHRNLLASASADTTVKLWDLTTQQCAKSYTYHSDKVCSLAWHPSEATAMLSGSYDRTVIAADMRAPESGTRKWAVDADVEAVKWDPHDDKYIYVTTESGMLYYFDARTGGANASPVWRLQAHEKAITAFSSCAFVQGLLATGSDDRTVKLWDTSKASGTGPRGGPALVASRDLDLGRVFSVDFAPDEEVGLRLAAAGSKGSLRVWDTSTNKAVQSAFRGRIARRSATTSEGGGFMSSADEQDRIIGVGDGGVSSESESESDSNDEDGENAVPDEGDWEEADSDEEMGS